MPAPGLRRTFPFLLLWCAVAAALAAAPLRVGVEPVADRLSRLDAGGKPEGFAVDIARAVAGDQHLEVEFIAKPWPQLLEDFRANRLDLLAAVVAAQLLL